ncbi:Cyclin-A3-4 [Platanthera guangdongensis]|uniref:Cyclin-A3-4 n=1 Tax=Platanthera guangdongensis TaxID=2320717 RepID=A0ABR2MAV4_9ASPA
MGSRHRSALTMVGKEGVPPASTSKKRAVFAIIGSTHQLHRRPLAELPTLSNIVQKQGKRLGKQPYEESEPPKVEDLCYITDNTYTQKEALPPPSARMDEP